MKKRENQGELLHRPRTLNRVERKKEREERKRKWYGTTKYEAVMFIPATPDSELQKKIQSKVNELKLKVKVIERSGTKLVRMIQRNDPFKKKECSKPRRCLVCAGSKPGGCRDSGVTYKIECEDECDYEYTGQTNQNGFTRGESHLKEYKQQNEKNPLWKHSAMSTEATKSSSR